MTARHLSTTAMAKLIGKESKELFILLANSGWIVKVDNHWQLTEKGRFEGGAYANHPKYGEYIVWPETLSEHHLLALLPEAPLSARNLADKTGLAARLVNRVLATLGWIQPYVQGWHVTESGRRMGGQQQVSETSAIPYVTWPEALLQDARFLSYLEALRPGAPRALNGLPSRKSALTQINNWFYVVGIVHASNVSIAIAGAGGTLVDVAVDFYLPAYQLAVVFWPEKPAPGELSANLDKQQKLQQSGQRYIELGPEDLPQLDEVMTRSLIQVGVAVYA